MYNPVSTYRIQFHQKFTLRNFKEIIDYLHELGIVTIYASPLLEAAPGSLHGYNGVNPHRINPEIGTENELTEISRILHTRNMGWIQDIAPNHMCYHQNNKWLMDVLLKGKNSAYAGYFDIIWNSPLYNGRVMVPFPGSELDAALKKSDPEEKHYKVCDWQETDRQINYRRFFIVNDLICTNIQFRNVFDDYHSYIAQLLKGRIFQGLRIDHIDGLFDPAGYLNNIRELAGSECFVVVEKILEEEETIPEHWPVQGNTGYDFLGMVNNVFTPSHKREAFKEFYEMLTGDNKPIPEQALEKKAHILYNHMQGELENLVRLYRQLDLPDTLLLDFTGKPELREAIATILIECPVYRYYKNKLPTGDDETYNKRVSYFYQRCMQFSGPLMAKGVEDTLMYTYNSFTGHNEVGDHPARFGISTGQFHQVMRERMKNWPFTMNATATHDTKRGEDARARLNALAAYSEEWFRAVTHWYQLNAGLQKNGAPDVNDEYLIYQALTAGYPMPGEDDTDFDERFKQFLTKAVREAKRNSNWASPNEAYENGIREFAGSLLDKSRPFWKSFQTFLEKILDKSILMSLAQVVLKFTCPGVPDTYQGSELWDLSFVDPDNRRPVDYKTRRKWLREIPGMSLEELWQQRYKGKIKLWLVNTLLKARKEHARIFSDGAYIPLEVSGGGEHILAFARQSGDQWVIAAVARNAETVEGGLARIRMPDNAPVKWKHLLTGAEVGYGHSIPVTGIFKPFPFAVLTSTGNYRRPETQGTCLPAT